MIVYRDRAFCARKDCPVTKCDRNSCHVPWQSLPEYMGVSLSDFYGKSNCCPVEPPEPYPVQFDEEEEECWS